MPSLVPTRRSVESLAAGNRETARPAASADRHYRPTPNRLFYVCDNNTHTRFLIDTDSEVSVIPLSPTDRRHPPDKLTLTAINDTLIPMFGKRSLTLDLGLRRSFPWIFIVADMQRPILGADFLRYFGLLVDMK
jgi:hypothetical protein